MKPDEQSFTEDLELAGFTTGVVRGLWGPMCIEWPIAITWIGVPHRPNSPERFLIRMDCEGYSSNSPTATFWDVEKNAQLENSRWPKGCLKITRVFRLDWESGKAFYHPYDRIASKSHDKWPKEIPGKIWTPKHTIVDWLNEFHDLLNSDEYTGV